MVEWQWLCHNNDHDHVTLTRHAHCCSFVLFQDRTSAILYVLYITPACQVMCAASHPSHLVLWQNRAVSVDSNPFLLISIETNETNTSLLPAVCSLQTHGWIPFFLSPSTTKNATVTGYEYLTSVPQDTGYHILYASPIHLHVYSIGMLTYWGFPSHYLSWFLAMDRSSLHHSIHSVGRLWFVRKCVGRLFLINHLTLMFV